jgi:transcriptional regulator with XRE-family HTH domain
MPKNQKTDFELYVISKVRDKRMELNMSQEDVASILDKSRGFIGQIESPRSPAKYNLNHLNKLSAEFKCSPKDFMPDKPVGGAVT